MRLLEFEHMAGKFDRRYLHPEAQAEVGNLLFPGIPRGHDFPFNPALTETARHQNASQAAQDLFRTELLDLLSFNLIDLNPAIVGDAAMIDRLVDRFVSVVQFDILADDPNPNPVL